MGYFPVYFLDGTTLPRKIAPNQHQNQKFLSTDSPFHLLPSFQSAPECLKSVPEYRKVLQRAPQKGRKILSYKKSHFQNLVK